MSVAFAFNQVYAMRNILELMPVIGGLLTPRRLAKGVAVLLFGVVMFQTALCFCSQRIRMSRVAAGPTHR